MLQVRDNDAEAYGELVRRYQNRVLNLLEHLVGRGHQKAEDLTQDVLMRVWRARGTYKPGSKFSTWLFTIANNVASNARRSQARNKEVNVPPRVGDSQAAPTLDQMAPASSGTMPTQRVDKMELQNVVRTAVDQLPERQRLAVLLKIFENASYADIAEIMELTPQAVKSLLSRARNNLKDLLAPYVRQSGPLTQDAAEQSDDEDFADDATDIHGGTFNGKRRPGENLDIDSENTPTPR